MWVKCVTDPRADKGDKRLPEDLILNCVSYFREHACPYPLCPSVSKRSTAKLNVRGWMIYFEKCSIAKSLYIILCIWHWYVYVLKYAFIDSKWSVGERGVMCSFRLNGAVPYLTVETHRQTQGRSVQGFPRSPTAKQTTKGYIRAIVRQYIITVPVQATTFENKLNICPRL